MKNLILLRHAKSSWKDSRLDDFERPLNKRGKQTAPLIANILLSKNILIHKIISSPSKRTTETSKIFASILKYEQYIIFEPNLYLASDIKILNTIKMIDEKSNNVLLVAHNPGITNLANKLCEHRIENIPTSGMIGFSFDGEWKNFTNEKCKFLFYEFPKKIN
jgi:phosphohistidine phosphatase